MKKQNVFMMLVSSACFCLAPLTVSAQQAVQIMPMGDSITARGTSPESSYRFWLYSDLTNAGYSDLDFTFIGNQNGTTFGSPANSWPDEAYEGGAVGYVPDGDGWNTQDGVSAAPSAATLDGGPNVVLLELGQNDFLDDIPLDETETNFETIIQDFASNNSGVVILLARVPRYLASAPQTQSQADSGVAKLNGVIRKAAGVERKAGVDVVLVSLGGYNPRTETVDGTHPNVKGEQYIARQFYNALRPVLKKMGVEPQKQSKR